MSGDIDLSTINWSNYDLVVIDESHNFRIMLQEIIVKLDILD